MTNMLQISVFLSFPKIYTCVAYLAVAVLKNTNLRKGVEYLSINNPNTLNINSIMTIIACIRLNLINSHSFILHYPYSSINL